LVSVFMGSGVPAGWAEVWGIVPGSQEDVALAYVYIAVTQCASLSLAGLRKRICLHPEKAAVQARTGLQTHCATGGKCSISRFGLCESFRISFSMTIPVCRQTPSETRHSYCSLIAVFKCALPNCHFILYPDISEFFFLIEKQQAFSSHFILLCIPFGATMSATYSADAQSDSLQFSSCGCTGSSWGQHFTVK